MLRRAKQLLLSAKAVVRHDRLPLAVDVHPDIGQTIMVFVRFTLRSALFMISPGDHGGVAVHTNFEIGHL